MVVCWCCLWSLRRRWTQRTQWLPPWGLKCLERYQWDQFVRPKTLPVHGNLFNGYSRQLYNMNTINEPRISHINRPSCYVKLHDIQVCVCSVKHLYIVKRIFLIGPNNSKDVCWLCQRSLPMWPNCFTWWSHDPGNWACAESVTYVFLLQTAAPSCLAYLDNRVVFVGSTLGDSQLVKVRV